MAGGTQDNDDAEIVAINVTPLVDITLVLLIIFMVTASVIVNKTIDVDLPRAAQGNDTIQGLVNVVMDRDSKLYFDGAEVDEPNLMGHIDEALKKDKETRAIITADQSLNYGRVMHLIDIVKGAGISKFALNIQKEAAPAAAGGTP
jgi:biopolymer transport protein ExbD